MKQYIDKNTIVAELNRLIAELVEGENTMFEQGRISAFEDARLFINSLKVKEDEDNYLEKFKSLQHITGDLHKTLEDWGYAPNLYYFDGSWHVDWISCEEGDSIKGFTENTAEEAINKAYNWFHSTFCNG